MAQTKASQKNKMYVLDTNVLLHDPTAIFGFPGALVGIPAVVLEEMDTFKRETTDRGRNARETIRFLDKLRQTGSLGQGVHLDGGGTLKVLFFEVAQSVNLPFDIGVKDNEILLIALGLQKKGNDVVFISKDLNARVKADALGLKAEDYLKEHVTPEEFYKGWVQEQVAAVELKREFPSILDELAGDKVLALNEFVLVESKSNSFNYRIFRYLGGSRFRHVQAPVLQWPLGARNPQQAMALDLLLDPSIQLVTLLGAAGTGKTFLALLAGLHKVLIEEEYKKMLVSRPVVPLGKDLGYLPGDIKEKLHAWMMPIYDNMEFIVHSAGSSAHQEKALVSERLSVSKSRQRHDKRHRKDAHERRSIMPLEELERRGKISMEAITYMRGRSIPYQYILIDEAQNLTPHEVKTIVTRAGEGSKIVLVGDPYQIDSPYLDFSSNGLTRTSERFKDQAIFGSVFLSMSERSELSKLAGELL